MSFVKKPNKNAGASNYGYIAETSNLAIMEVAFANTKEHSIFGNRYSCLMIFKDPIHRIRLWETLAR